MSRVNRTSKTPLKTITPYSKTSGASDMTTVNTQPRYSNLKLYDMSCNTSRLRRNKRRVNQELSLQTEADIKTNDISRFQILKQKITQETSESANSELKNAASKLSKSVTRTSSISNKNTMSIRRVNYNDIFKNHVYNNIPSLPNFPKLKKDSLKASGESSTVQKNRYDFDFPNTDMTLGISTSYSKQKGKVKLVLEINNLNEDDNFDDIEEHLVKQIQDGVKNLALK